MLRRWVGALGFVGLAVAACSDGKSSSVASTTESSPAVTQPLTTDPPAVTSTVPPQTVPFVPSGRMCPPSAAGRIAYELGFEGGGADGSDLWTVQVVHTDGSSDSLLIGGEQYLGIGQPAWSPDGTRAVVAATEAGFEKFLVVRCDGTIETVLEGLEMETASYPLAIDSPAHPSWSPDGSTIAFSSADGLFLIDPANPYPTRQVDIGIDLTVVRGRAAWSPDSTRLVFGATDPDGNTDLYAVGTDGSGLTRLTTDPADDYQPAWSPDGTRIAFRSMRDGKLWMMAADGSQQRALFSGEGAAPAYQPSWSPDGRELVYVSGVVGDTRVHIVGADGNGDRQLTAPTPSPRFEGWPVWVSP
ncbi:MAG: hypothetical protein WCC60_13020 [Ilumatobacteraceae bacterium]